MDELAVRTTNGIQAAQITDYYADFERFLSHEKPQTRATYTRALKQWRSYLEESGITAPTRDNVVEYLSWLRATPTAKGKKREESGVAVYLAALKAFFSWLESRGLYQNITGRVKPQKIDHSEFRRDYLTADALRAVLGKIERGTVKGARDAAVITLASVCGLRTIEIVRADAQDLKTVGGQIQLFVQGKGEVSKKKFVKVPGAVMDAIKTYYELAGTPEGEQPLFRSDSNRNQGERLTTLSVRRVIKARLRAAGYDDERLTAHSLRHSAAVLYLESGHSLADVQSVLRHANATTTRIYSHMIERKANTSEQDAALALFGISAA